MVTTHTDASYKGGSASASARILPRQVSSLMLVVLLYTAATPFSPISWLTGPIMLTGTYFFDRLLAGFILFCAFYFQWAIASLRSSIVISLPTGGTTTQVRNGRMEQVRGESVPLWVWQTGDYWLFALAEAGLLLVAEFAGSETMRRLLVGVVILGLWVVGWSATPASLKRWAWEHIKTYLFFLLLDELRNVAAGTIGGMIGGGQRRRRARW